MSEDDHDHGEQGHGRHGEPGHGRHGEPGHDHDHGEHGHGDHGEQGHGDHDHDHDDHDHGDHDHGDHDHGDHDHGHGRLRQLLWGHSHDTGESVANALETSSEGLRAIKLSLVGLGITAAFQVVIVAISGSVALLGDTIHNFADALTAVPLGLAFLVGRRPPSRRYTYGYGRAEDLAGMFIVAMIALSAALAGWEAVLRLMHPQEVNNLGWVMAAGVIGFAGNELVASYRIRVGRRIGSAALVADGRHARTDGLTSLAVVLGAAGVAVGWERADPIVGLLITVVILGVLKGAARDVYRRIMDSVDPALVEQVGSVLAAVEGIEEVDDVRIRWVGHQLRAEAEVVCDCELSFTQAHDIAELAHHELLHRIPRLAQATIHASPCRHDGRDHHSVTAHHFNQR